MKDGQLTNKEIEELEKAIEEAERDQETEKAELEQTIEAAEQYNAGEDAKELGRAINAQREQADRSYKPEAEEAKRAARDNWPVWFFLGMVVVLVVIDIIMYNCVDTKRDRYEKINDTPPEIYEQHNMTIDGSDTTIFEPFEVDDGQA